MILSAGSLAIAADLRVGVDTAFVPFEFKGKDGKYTGFDVDLWAAIAKRMNVSYELVPMGFQRLDPRIDHREPGCGAGCHFHQVLP